MDPVKLADTLDLATGFVVNNDDYWKGRAGVAIRSTPADILESAFQTSSPAELEAKIITTLKANHASNLSQMLAYLNGLEEEERTTILAEYCRQRFLRDVQEGYDQGNAEAALEALKNLGVAVPKEVI